MSDRGVRPGWYWRTGWSRMHYVANGYYTLCQHVARSLTAGAPAGVTRCKVCARILAAAPGPRAHTGGSDG